MRQFSEAAPVRNDHDRAAEELWDDLGQAATRFAAALVGPNDASEIAAEAFSAALPALLAGTVDSPQAYLYRSTSNRAKNLQRSRARRWARDLRAVDHRHVEPPDTFIDVRNAVAGLSVRQRAVIFLVYWEDRTEKQAAEILQLAPGTVRRHLVRAKGHLRKALG